MFVWDWFTGVLGMLGKIIVNNFLIKYLKYSFPLLLVQVYGKNLESYYS
jgi:hypothetical protein